MEVFLCEVYGPDLLQSLECAENFCVMKIFYKEYFVGGHMHLIVLVQCASVCASVI